MSLDLWYCKVTQRAAIHALKFKSNRIEFEKFRKCHDDKEVFTRIEMENSNSITFSCTKCGISVTRGKPRRPNFAKKCAKCAMNRECISCGELVRINVKRCTSCKVEIPTSNKKEKRLEKKRDDGKNLARGPSYALQKLKDAAAYASGAQFSVISIAVRNGRVRIITEGIDQEDNVVKGGIDAMAKIMNWHKRGRNTRSDLSITSHSSPTSPASLPITSHSSPISPASLFITSHSPSSAHTVPFMPLANNTTTIPSTISPASLPITSHSPNSIYTRPITPSKITSTVPLCLHHSIAPPLTSIPLPTTIVSPSYTRTDSTYTMKEQDTNNQLSKEDVPVCMYHVKEIKGDRINIITNREEYLVSWVGFEESENTWEPEEYLKHCIPFQEYMEQKTKENQRKRRKTV